MEEGPREEAPGLSDQDVARLLGALKASMQARLRFTDALALLNRAGLPNLGITDFYWAPLFAAVDRAFFQLEREARIVALQLIAEGIVGDGEDDEVRVLLQRHGFEFVGNQFVPVALLDAREAAYVPASSASEIAKAFQRLVDADESGAITSACGAVDLVTARLYERHGLGNPGHASFSTKVNTSLAQLNVFDSMRGEFEERGMTANEAAEVVDHIRRATNHAAQALQILRREMGDAHGSKNALRQTAYDAIKWASAICAMMEVGQ